MALRRQPRAATLSNPFLFEGDNWFDYFSRDHRVDDLLTAAARAGDSIEYDSISKAALETLYATETEFTSTAVATLLGCTQRQAQRYLAAMRLIHPFLLKIVATEPEEISDDL